uniref:Peptidase metallopeptidase domain-containing protein n=1 Tax=Strigamia maritima TaxID=126957 RepID=T1IJX9_STRMM
MSPSFTEIIILIFSILKQCDFKPVLKPPSPTAIEYMRRFGYLEGVGSDAENLYKEETIINAIKTMQKYGGIEQTGIVDNDTVALFSTPRCGVPDVNPRQIKRPKRYVIGSEGWKKRTVTYYIANWSPKLGEQTTETQLNKAFKVWGDYSGLKFNQTHDVNADIILFFARGPHGDGYPMDGPGNILAHAFYPYEHGSYGGDVHFDEDEDWVNGSEDGFDFFTVAVHEIGHSLGLAHSHEPNSLMFPYYKGYNADFRLGYDDILGVYQLYISRPLEDDENHSNTNDNSQSAERDDEQTQDGSHEHEDEEKHDDDSHKTDQDDASDENEYSNEVIDNEEDSDYHFENESETGTSTPSSIPNICDGYDTITTIRGELFVFRDEWVWRFKDTGLLDENYPVKFQQLFRFPRRVKRIDAAYERPQDNKIVFFTGNQYYLFDGNKITSPEPLSLANISLPAYVDKLDAALIWGKNLKTYFFYNDEYWRYDDLKNAMDDGYPRAASNWKGIPFPVTSALQWTDGKSYFFIDKDFYRFNDQEVIADEQYPLPAFGYWFGC